MCLCCDDRITRNERRPVNGKSIRLFVATRVFLTCLPIDGFICNKCRLMYNKWRCLPEFHDVLMKIDECQQIRSEADGDNSEETEVNEEYMEDENDCDHLVDDASGEARSTDNGSSDDQPMNSSSDEVENDDDIEMYSNKSEEESENEEMYSNKSEDEEMDSSKGEDEVMDKEINSDESNEAVSSILYPRYISIFLCRHRCVQYLLNKASKSQLKFLFVQEGKCFERKN